MSRRDYSPIIKEEGMKSYPLSYQQERLLYMSKLNGSSNVWNRVSAVYLHGRLDVNALNKTMEVVIKRHSILNNTIQYTQGEYRQSPNAACTLKIVECSPETTKEEIVNNIYNEKIEVVGGQLFYAYYFLMGENNSMIIFKFHHIISDAHSFEVLWNLFKSVYNSTITGTLLPEDKTEHIQFYDYATWMRQEFTDEKTTERRSYWSSIFAEKTYPLNIQSDYVPHNDEIFQGASLNINLSGQFAKDVEKACIANRVIPFVFYLGAYFLLLSKYSCQDDIVVGTMFSGRHYKKFLMENIGFFVNTVAIRNKINREWSIKEYLIDLLETVNDAYYMQDYPLERIVKFADTASNKHINPLFQALFNYISDEYGSESFVGISNEIKVRPVINSTQSPIMLDIHKDKHGLEISVEYFTNLLSPDFIARWLNNYSHTLCEMLGHWDQPISSLEFICDKEKNIILNDFARGATRSMPNKLIHTLFEEQAKRLPNNIAISNDGLNITYCELNKRANSIAHTLLSSGLNRGNIVAIIMDDKSDFIASIYGALKAGGAYMPIEQIYPYNRVVKMIENSGASYLLTDQDGEIYGFDQSKVIEVDKICGEVSSENVVFVGESHDLAHVIFTSGSTGEPKGVMIEHCSVVNLFQSMRNRIDLRDDDVILALTLFTFDIFVVETLFPLSFGLKVVMTDEKVKKNPRLINESIINGGVTILQMTPSRMKAQLSVSTTNETLKHMRHIILGGEVLPSSLFDDIRSCTDARIHNMYAPSETTVYSTHNDITQGTNISIGRPLDNVSICLLDQYGKLQPIGVIGQLCISGIGLSRGYIGRDDLTAERFVANPYLSGERMYMTGDYGKWAEDGTIQFVGRRDQQVKLNGYRIELVEIEETLMLCDNIETAVAVVNTDTNGIQRLVAFIVVNDKEKFSIESINKSLSKWLPSYMFPSNYVLMDSLPLNSNGKVDRIALSQLEAFTEEGEAHESQEVKLSDTECKLIDIAEKLLQVKKLNINDNFFLKGGNSILTMLFAAEIEEVFDIQINILEFIELPVLSQIADHINIKKCKESLEV